MFYVLIIYDLLSYFKYSLMANDGSWVSCAQSGL